MNLWQFLEQEIEVGLMAALEAKMTGADTAAVETAGKVAMVQAAAPKVIQYLAANIPAPSAPAAPTTAPTASK